MTLKQWLRSILFGFILAAGVTVTSLAGVTVWRVSPFSEEGRAWRDACTLSGFSCSELGISQPLVGYDDVTVLDGTLGYYEPGAHVVFVGKNLNPDLEYAVMVHEMTHYIHYMNALHWGAVDRLDRCWSEKKAFESSDIVLRRLKLWAYVRNGNLDGYGCESKG